MQSAVIYWIFKIISIASLLYSFMCIARIVMTWIPQMAYSPIARFLSKACDPYLNLFRGIRWLRIGMFDFSPALALCLLNLVHAVSRSFANARMFSLTVALALIVESIWSIISSILIFFIIVMAVRLFLLYRHRNQYPNQIESAIDSSIQPMLYKFLSAFSHGQPMEYRKALIISIAVFLVILVAGGFLVTFLSNLIFLR